MSGESTASTLVSTLGEITSVLTAGGPVASAVTAVANAVTEVGKLVEPVLSEDVTQKLQNEYIARIQKAAELLSAPVTPDSEQQLGDYFNQLCIDYGVPYAGGVDASPLRNVRVGFLLSVASGLAKGIKSDAQLYAIESSLKASNPQPASSATTP
jgi:hypothetical protein